MISAAERIITFPGNQTDSWPDELWPSTMSGSHLSLLVSSIITNPHFAEAVRSLVEGYAVQTILRSLEKRTIQSDPFDPIYLVDLKPDAISRTDAQRLWVGAKKVRDLSAGVDLFENEE